VFWVNQIEVCKGADGSANWAQISLLVADGPAGGLLLYGQKKLGGWVKSKSSLLRRIFPRAVLPFENGGRKFVNA